MAGIYIHIPFCKSRCDYCDFYSTALGGKIIDAYVSRACREMAERKEYLAGAHIDGIYIGGGTPSRLLPQHLEQLCSCIYNNFVITPDVETTIEVNPDDMTDEYATVLRLLPFNRVSMGVQSFDDALLSGINRRHNALQAIKAFERLRRAGFYNISIDLIYALPNETLTQWESDVTQAVELRPEHISAYALSYERGTPLYERRRTGGVDEADDEVYLHMYDILIDKLVHAGYEHYEISNFALAGRRARHNSLYWRGEPYLGIGAGAHSFDGTTRRWNTADVKQYVAARNDVPHETECLTANMRYDEIIMTRLRTCEGIDLDKITSDFGSDRLEYLMLNARNYLQSGMLETYSRDERHMLRLTRRGIFISDGIMSDLMIA